MQEEIEKKEAAAAANPWSCTCGYRTTYAPCDPLVQAFIYTPAEGDDE
jgi:hypothetical protein